MLDVMEMAFVRGQIEYAGKFYNIPATAIGLQPRQKPLPPICHLQSNHLWIRSIPVRPRPTMRRE